MKKYLGVKIVDGEPCKAWKQSGDHPIGTEGYKVIYEGGYTSWSPVDVFDKAYRPIDGLTFGLAIEALKKGKKIRLQYWLSDIYLSLQIPDEDSKMTHEYIYVTSRFGLVPWVATQIEILSEKWIIIDA